MHRLLRRQLKRTLALNTEQEFNDFVATIKQQAASSELSPELQLLCQSFAPLLNRVDSSYEQYERDLDLRNRSLTLSSEELTQANQKIREEADRQARIIQTLRYAVNDLLTSAGMDQLSDDDSSLEQLSDLMASLLKDKKSALRELEQQKFALDQHAIVSITDKEGIIIYANDKFVSLSGYAHNELIGSPHSIINSGFHENALFADMWNTITSGKVWHGELKNQSKNGNHYWVASTIVPIMAENNIPERYIAIRTDISEQKLLEETMLKNQEFLQSVTNSMGEGIYALDNDGVCTFLNPEAEKQIGWTLADLAGRNFHDMVHSLKPDGTHISCSEWPAGIAVQQGKTFRSEGEYFSRKNGELFPISIVAVPLKQQGKIVGQVGVFQDITERQKTQQTLEQSQEQLQIALDASQTGLWDWNPLTDTAYFSEQWLGMLGYVEGDIDQKGSSWLTLLHPDDVERTNKALTEHFSGNKPTYEAEFRMRHKNGQWYWIMAAGQVTERDNEGNIVRVTGIHKDISDRKEIEKNLLESILQAENANRSKSDFLANMSHEIRTPMNAVIGLSYLVLQTSLNEQQRNYMSKIEHSAKNLLGIINDILDFSKIEAGRMDVEQVSFRIQDVLDQVTAVTAIRAEQKGLEMMVSRPTDLPNSFIGDPLRIGQVLINLVGNAVKFTETGDVTVSVELLYSQENKANLKFSVKDTGIGLSEPQIQKLFKSFSQADTSTTRKYGGTGLGLAISKNLVTLMGGTIEVESEPGVGSCFYFSLPLGVPEQSEPTLRDVATELKGLSVLIVDDRETARDILTTMCLSLGMKVQSTDNGQACIDLLNKQNAINNQAPFQLLIIDWKMPEMNGSQTLSLIANNDDIFYKPKSILVTAYSSEDDLDNDTPILTKPVTPSALLDTALVIFGYSAVNHHRIAHKVARDTDAIQGILGAHVLLVEDNRINQQVALALLEQLGLIVTIANNGLEAVAAVEKEVFELILMDIQMPEMDGYEATECIRKNSNYDEITIIALTAHAMADDRERCLAAKMDDYLTKPINPDDLFQILCKWIQAAQRQPIVTKLKISNKNKILNVINIEGLDSQQGLNRVRGNHQLYGEILERFCIDYQDCDIEQIFGNGVQEAEIFIHTLKGVSSTIGANKLAELAAEIENLLRNEQEVDNELFSNLNGVLATLVVDIQAVLDQLDSESTSNNNLKIDQQQLELSLSSLKDLIINGDLEAVDKTQELLDLFQGGPQHELICTLKRHVVDFEFEQAQICLDTLIDNLAAKSGETTT